MHNRLWAGIILAAGRGKRLIASGVDVPKPLARVCDNKTLLDIAYDALNIPEISRIYCITNNHYKDEILRHLSNSDFNRCQLITKNTRSAFYTFMSIANLDEIQSYVVVNVDSIVSIQAIQDAIIRFSDIEDSSLMIGFTQNRYNDENPLFIDIDEVSNKVLALGNDTRSQKYVTSGLYLGTASNFPLINSAYRDSIITLREFLGYLVARESVYGYFVSNSVDVDTAEDLEVAQKLYRKLHKKGR